MDQENQNFEEQSRMAKESTRKLKRNMLIVIISMVIFAVIAFPLIGFLDKLQTGGAEEETPKLPPSSIIFATPDYEYDIMKDPDYLQLNRRIYYCDERSGMTEELTDKTVTGYGPAAVVLRDFINTIIAGDADAYNALFSSNYYANHDPEAPFTMQRLYDIKLTKINESIVSGESGKYTQYEFEVEYKIRLNDGTYRTDIGHDESKKQYFILSDSTSEEVLIDQILEFNYSH
ncbi:MAG: hypothetical protein J6J01_02810 [Oscillospiraceae bacterium]|nr:hypothetical protein [Clostridia bacterium]MBP3698404.1 hypothetical protein [Oscillospiraceae bacterium]